MQLVYTTGLFDAGPLSAFQLIIRLRNDADRHPHLPPPTPASP